MSVDINPQDQPASSNESLQFERAEFNEGAALPCSFCKAPISGPYFQVNGQTACPNCREQVEVAVRGGSKGVRTIRALGAGIGAGVAGSLIYWGIRAATGYEIGLVSILVGFMVGWAVRWGSQGRGGIFYQLMAVVLTYFSIASNYTPEVIQGMRQARTESEVVAVDATATTDPNQTNMVTRAAASAPVEEQSLPFWIEVVFGFCISLAVPFLSGFSNIIGLAIIAFGLMQAWSMNKRVPIEFSGPFSAGGAAPPLQT